MVQLIIAQDDTLILTADKSYTIIMKIYIPFSKNGQGKLKVRANE